MITCTKETKDPNLIITVPKMKMNQVMKEQCTNPQKWSMIKCRMTPNTMLDKGETQVDIPNPVAKILIQETVRYPTTVAGSKMRVDQVMKR
jgi:hypothetical protein